MVVPWLVYSTWKIWVIHILVFLVFHVFSTAELISPCKTVILAVWAFSSNFLHDFTLLGIDMNYIYHFSSISTTFGALSKMTFLGQKCIPIPYTRNSSKKTFWGDNWLLIIFNILCQIWTFSSQWFKKFKKRRFLLLGVPEGIHQAPKVQFF